MHPKTIYKTNKYKSKGRPGIGGTKTGGERRPSLIFSKSRWQSSCQIVGWFFLRRWKVSSHISVSLAMKGLIYCNMPRKPLISLSVLGQTCQVWLFIFSESTSIPRSLTMCPNNFPEVTPKVHFLGFNLSLKCLILSKNLCKAAK